ASRRPTWRRRSDGSTWSGPSAMRSPRERSAPPGCAWPTSGSDPDARRSAGRFQKPVELPLRKLGLDAAAVRLGPGDDRPPAVDRLVDPAFPLEQVRDAEQRLD